MQVPPQLSPSSISSFRTCPLAWRLDYVERLERTPSLDANIGTFVHSVAEALCGLPASRRTLDEARAAATAAWAHHVEDEEWQALQIPADRIPQVKWRAWRAVQRWFRLEDPGAVTVAGCELWVHGEVGGVAMRGIVDRLDVDDATGGFVVTDYKTGKMPMSSYQEERLFGVWVYAHLVADEHRARPVTKVRHLYLGERPGEVVRDVTPDALAATAEVVASTHQEMLQACATGQFETRESVLCGWCSFKASCPAFGGDLLALLATGPRRVDRRKPVDENQQVLDMGGAGEASPGPLPADGPPLVGSPAGAPLAGSSAALLGLAPAAG
jgi:putative RecB family exonuclease